MRKTANVKLICLIAVIVVAAAVLLCAALCREPPSAAQDPPVVSPSPVVPTPTPTPEPEPTPTPEPTPEVTPTPEPTEPPYDVWSDPNVLWREDGGMVNYMCFDETFDPSVRAMNAPFWSFVESAGEENLIAFRLLTLYGPKISGKRLDLSKVFIPEEWESKGEIVEQLEVYIAGNCRWEELRTGISRALKEDAYYKNLEEMRIQLRSMRTRVMKGIDRNKYSWNVEGDRAYYGEVKRQLMADEEFVQLYREYVSQYDSYMEFYGSLYLQELSPLRELLIEKGFIPIYSEEDVEIADIWEYFDAPERSESWSQFGYDVYGFMRSRLWAFAGTKEQIGWIKAILKGEANDFPMLEAIE